MDTISRICSKYGLYIATGVAVVGATGLYVKKSRQLKIERVCGVDYPKDTVILHQPGRGKTIPSLGHLVMKLETYLRFNKIPFESDLNPASMNTGPKKKVPWIEYNGVTMGDSQLIIEFLNNKLNIDMDSHLTKAEKAQAWAIQKWIEEFIYWLNVRTRWVIFAEEQFTEIISSVTESQKKILKDWIDKMTYTVGVGRHSNDEVQEMVVFNLRQFAVLLGDTKFIMGDKMSVVDCAAFGILSEMRWATPSACEGRKLFESGEIPSVVNYLDRIKAQYWPDWDSLLTT